MSLSFIMAHITFPAFHSMTSTLRRPLLPQKVLPPRRIGHILALSRRNPVTVHRLCIANTVTTTAETATATTTCTSAITTTPTTTTMTTSSDDYAVCSVAPEFAPQLLLLSLFCCVHVVLVDTILGVVVADTSIYHSH